jgi:ABC-type multidrug transport system ATPase subunit
MQDDALQPIMTVRENMWFSANLRLPSAMTRKEKNQKIDSVFIH